MKNLETLKKTEGRFQRIITPESKLVDRINDSLLWGAMNYFREKGFTWLEVPTITKITGACENVDTLYSVNHFGLEAYLAQTGQLYLEAKIPLHEKVWTIITSSRAEEKADNRHLNQFQLIEFEHQGDFDSLLKHIEGAIKSMITETLMKDEGSLKELKRYDELNRWASEPFSKIPYTKAIEMLNHAGYNIKWGDDLTSQLEQKLTFLAGKKPLFITHFPTRIKFFNMRQNENDETIVNSADLIMPYSGESVGAAERENDYGRLTKRLIESPMFKVLSKRGKTIEDFMDYLNIVKENPILHSGCGIGFGRISQSVLGTDDIRVSTPFPLQRGVLY